MRLLIPLFLFVLLIAPVSVQAADATFFGPIIPPECNCEEGETRTAADYGCVLATVQNGMNLAISLSIIIAMFYMVLIGFQFITSAGNPSAREAARKRVMNLVFGFLLLLAAWLIVDFIMKTLYKEDATAGGVTLGPWNSILGSSNDKQCLKVSPPPPPLPSVTSVQTPPSTGTGTGTGSGANCPAADPSIMVAFPAAATSGETEKATQTTVTNFLAMREAALRDNVNLKVTDGFRSDGEQVSLWNQYCSSGTCSRAVARPCSLGGNGSNHNSGEALDISVGCSNGQSNCNTAAYNWLKANGGRWNFRNALPSDPVHWSPSGR